MESASVVLQAIDIHRETESTKVEIATAVAVKTQNAAKEQGKAVLQLVEHAAFVPERGIDVQA